MYVCGAASLWGKPTATNEDIVPGLTLLNAAQGNVHKMDKAQRLHFLPHILRPMQFSVATLCLLLSVGRATSTEYFRAFAITVMNL